MLNAVKTIINVELNQLGIIGNYCLVSTDFVFVYKGVEKDVVFSS